MDWIVSTGANLYHDTHFGLGLRDAPRHLPGRRRRAARRRAWCASTTSSSTTTVLLDTDAFFREIIAAPEFQRTMSTAEFHYLCGKYVRAREEALGLDAPLAARRGVGVRRAGLHLVARRLLDRHERGGEGARGQQARCSTSTPTSTRPRRSSGTPRRAAARARCGSWAAAARRTSCSRPSRRSRRCSGIAEKGHDYFLAVTDARPDTGGLSGATPAEAVIWGKIDPEQLPGTVICYTDSTIALPLLTAYALAQPRAAPAQAALRPARGA